MAGIVGSLTKDAVVELTAEEDVICSGCPNRAEGRCADREKVEQIDRMVLSACGLRIGQVLTWEEFSAVVRREIPRKDRLRETCGDCRWMEICQRKTARIKKGTAR